mmetsp:Transcript_18672/g.29452  ORF Transcript_18672/g.29452 Transcript_18672/m.29452 type:complete len:80 (-) Transcript_18672:660-899(-)
MVAEKQAKNGRRLLKGHNKAAPSSKVCSEFCKGTASTGLTIAWFIFRNRSEISLEMNSLIIKRFHNFVHTLDNRKLISS